MSPPVEDYNVKESLAYSVHKSPFLTQEHSNDSRSNLNVSFERVPNVLACCIKPGID
mgnify:CR=1 FL=1|jgi:hypothetical protein